MPNNKSDIIKRMVQPPSLASDQPMKWSYGSGTEIWAMIVASITGDIDTIEKMISKDPELVNVRFEYFSPLHFAAREGHIALVQFLLDHGADSFDAGGDSLLTMATDRGYAELTALFESIQKNKYHMAPEGNELAKAIRSFDLPLVRRMLAERPELLHLADEHGNLPIHWAVLTRQIALIDHLLEVGADINAKRPDGARPLDLTNGDYHYRSWYRDLPATALQRHEVLIGYLLARGAYLDISVAAKIGHLDRVRELLDEDPSLIYKEPEHVGYYSGWPLRNAAGAGHIEVVKLLLERGANPNQPEPGMAPKGSALFTAISNKHYEVIKLLLEHGANPNAPMESSGNCMSIAKHVGASRDIQNLVASYGGVMGPEFADVETLAAMLHANPQLNIPERLDDPQILRLILKHQPDYIKRSPDPAAWWSGGTLKNAEHAQWLIALGYDVTRRNWLGITLLHRCAMNNEKAVAALCLQHGADIDAIETEWNSTPLGWAARHGKNDMVEWLLQRGANPKLPVNEPWAWPVEWARRRGYTDIVQLLE
jgi:ankyrin repeat protein